MREYQMIGSFLVDVGTFKADCLMYGLNRLTLNFAADQYSAEKGATPIIERGHFYKSSITLRRDNPQGAWNAEAIDGDKLPPTLKAKILPLCSDAFTKLGAHYFQAAEIRSLNNSAHHVETAMNKLETELAAKRAELDKLETAMQKLQ